MTSKSPAVRQTVDEQQSADVALINNEALLQQFGEMAVLIPREDGNGTENILAQILSATSWEELDEPWQATDVDDILGRRLTLIRALRRPSSFKGGLGQFVVCFMQDKKTGKEVVKATGSISIVGQVARAYALNCLPLEIEWCRADRPTENGFYPQHLAVFDGVTRTATQVG
jgi:hypothetical protein